MPEIVKIEELMRQPLRRKRRLKTSFVHPPNERATRSRRIHVRLELDGSMTPYCTQCSWIDYTSWPTQEEAIRYYDLHQLIRHPK